MTIEFDGVDDYIACGSDSSLDDLVTVSVALWIDPDTWTTYRHMVVKGDYDNATGCWMFYSVADAGSTAQLRLLVNWSGATAYWDTDSKYGTVGSWAHVAFTYDGGSTDNDPIFYVNGDVAANTEQVAPSGTLESDAAEPLEIGRRTTGEAGRNFDGHMQDVRVYGRILTAAEIARLANHYRDSLGGEVLWECTNMGLTARFHDYNLTAPQHFTISSNKVQLTAPYHDYNLNAPKREGYG